MKSIKKRKDKKEVVIAFRIDQRTAKKLAAKAKKQKQFISDYMRTMVADSGF